MFVQNQFGIYNKDKLYKSNMAEKLDPVYPKSSLTVNLKVDGIFAYPDEWRVTDEANPGMFTYIIRMSNVEITNGKICPRELTQKQLREQQQAKNKKSGKKQAKKQENPAQLQRLKQQQERQQTEQRKRQELWASLSQQQRFYSTSQDKHKSALLKFEPNSISKQFSQKSLVILEQRILKDGGQWIYLYKVPLPNEQQLAKLKKSKPKNLNLNDLNPICMKAWVDLSTLKSSELKEIQIRCKVQQIDATQETPKPNLQKTYVKLAFSLSEPLISKTDPYTINSIIKNPPQPKQVPLDVKYVNQMKQQLRLAIQSLAMQYSNMFWKQLNLSQQNKAAQIFVNSRKNDHVKRKQQFLYDFNVSGKYKVLKQRLKRVVVHLCQSKFADKMQGSKSFTGITCSVRDQFYSEIYNFLVSSYSTTINQLIQQKKQTLKQVFVLNQSTQNKITEQHLQQFKKQSQEERFNRIVKEYNIVGNYEYGRKMYKSTIQKQPNNISLKYQYSIFCIENGLNSISEILSWGYIEQYLEYNKQNREARIQYILLMIGTEEEKNLKKAWILLRQLILAEPNNIQFYLYASILTEMLGKVDVGNKILSQAERLQLRKQGKISQEGRHKESPNFVQIPSLTSIAKYQFDFKPEKKDELWLLAIQKFSQLSVFNIIERIKVKISKQDNPLLQKQQIKLLFSQQKYQQCKQKAYLLFNGSKNFEVLKIIIKCCRNLQQSEQEQRNLKTALKMAPNEQKSQVLLNLGYYYYLASKYGNAKACLTKYLEGNAQAGGLSWQILGISELKSNNFEQAIECFRYSNLCDPYNKQLWLWLAQTYANMKNFVMVNQCLNCYLDLSTLSQTERNRIEELKQSIQKWAGEDFYEIQMRQKLISRLKTH